MPCRLSFGALAAEGFGDAGLQTPGTEGEAPWAAAPRALLAPVRVGSLLTELEWAVPGEGESTPWRARSLRAGSVLNLRWPLTLC